MNVYNNSLPEIEEDFEGHMNEVEEQPTTNTTMSIFSMQEKENARSGGSRPQTPQITQSKKSQVNPPEKSKPPTQTQKSLSKKSTILKSNPSEPGKEVDLLEKWCDYYPETQKPDFDNSDFRHLLIKLLYDSYLLDPKCHGLYEWGNEKHFGLIDVYIDYQKFKETHNQNIREIFGYFADTPSDILPAICIALDRIRVLIMSKPLKKVTARFYNFDHMLTINEIKSDMILHYVSVKGIVLRTCSVKLLTTYMEFSCIECKEKIKKVLPDGVYTVPVNCKTDGCKSRVFTPDKTTAKHILYQRLQIQELNDEVDLVNTGRVPKTIECELKESLVSSLISGDTVIVNGILKPERANELDKGFSSNKSRTQGLFTCYIDVNSVTNQKHNSRFSNTGGEEEFSEDDLKIIGALSDSPNLFPLLVKSFCPAIYGHELVKAGVLLSIVGGSVLEAESESVSKGNSGKYRTSLRPDCHMLLIGDPGLGKSQLLKFVTCIAPRGVYICGNATSTAGLTVTVQKDAQSGESSMEAGALVLSDQGVCCIDEFDKMSNEHLSLLEAMEQQTVSIAKSGVLCSLSARTTIIASANPIGGHYNKSKNIRDNIKISNAILSRFDLMFLMLDHPDPNRDKKLSEHVMKLHNNAKKRTREEFEQAPSTGYDKKNDITFSQFQNKFQTNFYSFRSNQKQEPTKPYEDRSTGFLKSLSSKRPNNIQNESDRATDMLIISLSEKMSHAIEKIPQESILDIYILRKYIAYIKKNVHPWLSSEAATVIRDFFISLRAGSESSYNLKTTTRHLESLIRLSQARAKIECRTEVTKEDAMEVVALMQESLFDALEDLSSGIVTKGGKKGGVAFNPSNVGVLSVPKQTKHFIEKLREKALIKGDAVFEFKELTEVAKSLNMQVGDFSEYIDKLNFQNYFLMRGKNVYELKSLGI